MEGALWTVAGRKIDRCQSADERMMTLRGIANSLSWRRSDEMESESGLWR